MLRKGGSTHFTHAIADKCTSKCPPGSAHWLQKEVNTMKNRGDETGISEGERTQHHASHNAHPRECWNRLLFERPHPHPHAQLGWRTW